MILTMNQMQQQLLLAYQTSKKRPKMSMDFGIYEKELTISVYFFLPKHCVNVCIYNHHDDEQKISKFNQVLLYINGELNPFEEE